MSIFLLFVIISRASFCKPDQVQPVLREENIGNLTDRHLSLDTSGTDEDLDLSKLDLNAIKYVFLRIPGWISYNNGAIIFSEQVTSEIRNFVRALSNQLFQKTGALTPFQFGKLSARINKELNAQIRPLYEHADRVHNEKRKKEQREEHAERIFKKKFGEDVATVKKGDFEVENKCLKALDLI
ncbi:hypothetical protein Ddc_16282 [Ditylenchus destructor]|nr:hypothetical protein Ddc_16282 [Ditylenchus destructor]